MNDKHIKPWYHPNWRAKAFDNLNEICETMGCTYAGGIRENRVCKIKHCDCDLIKELLEPNKDTK